MAYRKKHAANKDGSPKGVAQGQRDARNAQALNACTI